MNTMFRDREDAAFRLAALLKGRPFQRPLVLAIPRGGVVTGAILASELGAELDVDLARKLRAPGNPEAALGAVAEGGAVYVRPAFRSLPERYARYLAAERDHQLAEIARRAKLFRGARPPADVTG